MKFFEIFRIFLSILVFASAIQVRKNEPWSMILCQFQDDPAVPHSREFYKEWLTNPQKSGSVPHFFQRSSQGLYTIDGSNVLGWFKIPIERRILPHLARSDRKLSHLGSIERKIPYKISQLCLRAAKTYRTPLHKKKIIIVNHGNYAVFTAKYGILLSPRYSMTSALVHEMVHSFNVGHSFSNRRIMVYPHSKFGEYDDRFDLMSTSNALMFQDTFGFNGPGLSGPHLDFLGWLPQNRMVFFQSPQKTTVRIASLSTYREITDYPLLISVPYDRDNPLHVFTIEYRTKEGLDFGIKHDSVVLREIKSNNGFLYSYLLTAGGKYSLSEGNTYFRYLDGPKEPRPYIKIKVLKMYRDFADIDIHSTFSPTDCRAHETPRQATPNDKVCVHKKGTKYNSQFLDKKWNEYERFFERETFGLNACRRGYVWRGIDQFDYTCVYPGAKIRAEFQNSRQIKNSGVCVDRYRQRAAFPGDVVCVTDAEFDATHRDNDSLEKQKYQKFFNGVDEVR